ncbi:aspartyl-phosphate phosphatase Spo0E family protein [Desulfosporosinus lacus]|uniref:Spo0E like sporulation regulatory protein n=1 Tax=Desulfosporosinus lacus DSM 15449 TaxID=1121420 RepID=A0A1M5WFT6_9FIRM|nr:aspartyl-phosphate phosphatase Spo0E family protein [Desulfosporosinus lacus]SHH86352.1 Spo0E like sporulation regulatory protein [Desulfosporosinus lacus DSM 15449]
MKLNVLDRIEELRLQMQEIALDKDLSDPIVVRVSEDLDAWINKFYFNHKKKKRKQL